MDEYLEQALRLSTDYIVARSVAIVIRNEHGGTSIGSSTCVRIGDHCLLATAGHVIEHFGDEQIALVPPGRWPGRGPLRMSSRSCYPGRPAPSTDVAWIELEPSSAVTSGLKFLELDDLLPGQRTDYDHPFIVHGYPYEAAIFTEESADVEATVAFTMMAKDSELPRPLAPDELALEWPPRMSDGRPIPGVVSPAGVSGGATWRQPRHDEHVIMSPTHFRLVALNLSWCKSASILYVTRIENWLGLVAQDMVDTRQLIAALGIP
jgi:hypothetical protein